MSEFNLIERIIKDDDTQSDPWSFVTYNLPASFIRNAIANDWQCYQAMENGVIEKDVNEILSLLGNYKEIADFNGKNFLYFDKGTNSFIYYGVSEETPHIRGNSDLNKTLLILTTNVDIYKRFKKVLKDSIKKTKKDHIHVLMSDRYHGYRISPAGEIKDDFERENYSEDVVESFDYVVENFSKENPPGRLTILSGLPGTGKTYFVRGLVKALKNSYVIMIPSNLLSSLDSPSLLPTLIDHKSYIEDKNMVFVVEDADPVLVKRMNDNVCVLSSLLNFTDGILGVALDLRIVTTTNAERIEFDDALMRPGRLLSHVEIGSLPPEKCNEIYERLTGKEGNIKEQLTLAEVYAKTRGQSKKKKKKEKKLGFSV